MLIEFEKKRELEMKSIKVNFGGEMALAYRNRFRKGAHRYYLFLPQSEILLLVQLPSKFWKRLWWLTYKCCSHQHFLIYFSSTPNEDNDWMGLQEWFPWNHWCQMLAQDWEHRGRFSVHSSSHPALSFPSLMFTLWFLIELWIRKCNTKGSHYY